MHQNQPAYHLGLVYLRQGQLDQAKAAFEQAITISPQYPEAYYNLGSIPRRRGFVTKPPLISLKIVTNTPIVKFP
jgi:Tfp pilus assembly protein PilF